MADRYASSYHGRKNKFLGNEARVAPAWKDQARANRTPNGVATPKSKILLSYLPPDVGPDEVHVRGTVSWRVPEEPDVLLSNLHRISS